MTRPPAPSPDPADETAGGEVIDITPLDQPPDVEVEVPGSKSLTNRALLCAALARGRTRLEGVLFADDTEAMMGTVAALGATLEVDRARRRVVVEGLGGPPRPRPGTRLDARMSGTTGRFVLPVAATAGTEIVVDGHPQLRARPLAPLVDALTDLGATVTAVGEPGRLPLAVRGPLTGSRVRLPADVSSQFVSGLLLAGPLLARGLTVELTTEPVSAPYLDLTVATMQAFGARVERPRATLFVVSGGGYTGRGRHLVEPDASAASYFLAAAAVTGGRVTVRGLGRRSLQGDVTFAEVLARMGARVRLTDDEIEVRGDTLRGVDVDLADLSDTAPTLAVVAACAEGTTRVRGIGFVRGKESDRIAAPVRELRRCGVDAIELDDGFEIRGGAAPHGAVIRTYDDHRMAMAFAVLGLVVPGIRICDPGCVAKTFPDFFTVLDTLRGRGGRDGGQVE